MNPRPSARSLLKAAQSGTSKLIFARIIVTAENILRVFGRPLLLAGAFVGLAWLGVFEALYPWAHLVALVLFTAVFFDSLGRARTQWKPLPVGLARRRVEEASGLTHRPLDVLDDRPAIAGETEQNLWQMHAARAREQIAHLRWPRWKKDSAGRDPYALRYALLVVLMVGLLSGWGALGGRLIAAINPALGHLHTARPALDAWITPPDYTHMAPIMIATPAGPRHDGEVIEVPEGSVISAHLAEKDGAAPTLEVNDHNVAFSAPDKKDFEAAETVASGDRIVIRRGWDTLGSWHIRVVPDQAPQIAFSEPAAASERKSVRIGFEASDDYGVTAVRLRVTPRESLPGADNSPVDIALASPEAKDVKRVSFEDLTAHPWAGQAVQLQLIATDAVGHEAVSGTSDFVLPEREFFNPVARALIEERKKLLQSPLDDSARTEAANVMAGVAHQPSAYNGDPVVLMALRAGAVRLVLDHDTDSAVNANDILWQSAVRIEDGTIGTAEENLRKAQRDLADALDRGASEEEIQRMIDRLHEALAQYLSSLSTRMAAKPGPVEDLSQFMGPSTNMLTPQDLERMLDRMRNLSASGARGAALQELAQLQQTLESLRTGQPQLNEGQRQALAQLKALHELTHDQQNLIDRTFQSARDGHESKALAGDQSGLLRRLQDLTKGMKGAPAITREFDHGADAMQRADKALEQGAPSPAVASQNEALGALQKAEEAMVENLRQSMFMMPQGGMGAKSDPFGRYSGLMRDDGGVKVPEQLRAQHVREILDELQRRAGDISRSKTERDYIERLLQNF